MRLEQERHMRMDWIHPKHKEDRLQGDVSIQSCEATLKNKSERVKESIFKALAKEETPTLHQVRKCKSLNKLYFLIYIRTSGVLQSSAHAIATSYILFNFLWLMARLFKFMHVEFHICNVILFYLNVHVWLSYQHVYRFKLFLKIQGEPKGFGVWIVRTQLARTHDSWCTYTGSCVFLCSDKGHGTADFRPFFPWKLTKPCVGRACRSGARRLTSIAE